MATILMWSTLEFTRDILGDLGIVSLIFVVIMFGSGLLTTVDFNSFNWHTLMLLGGGSILGKAISSSGLLSYLVG
jgi:phosphate transporter